MSGWTISVHGTPVRFVASEDRTVLESAELAGLTLPYGCRTGACLNCAARLHSGRLSMPPGTALSDADLAQQIFLPCCAVPRSDCEVELGGALGVLDVPPWTD